MTSSAFRGELPAVSCRRNCRPAASGLSAESDSSLSRTGLAMPHCDSSAAQNHASRSLRTVFSLENSKAPEMLVLRCTRYLLRGNLTEATLRNQRHSRRTGRDLSHSVSIALWKLRSLVRFVHSNLATPMRVLPEQLPDMQRTDCAKYLATTDMSILRRPAVHFARTFGPRCG